MPHAAHAWLPETALKVCAGQVAHVRSELVVALLSMNSPAPHGALTAAHELPSLTLEYSMTPSHATQVRSAVAEPSCCRPKPTAQVRQAVHASLPAVPLKVPCSQLAHVRSDDAPGATVSYWPAAQMVMALHTRSAVPLGATDVYWSAGHVSLCVRHVRSVVSVGLAVSYSFAVHVVTATHASPLAFGEYVEPATHVAHWRFAIALPATAMPEPVAQMFHAVHAVSPATAVNVPASHAAHVRSLLAVAAAVV